MMYNIYILVPMELLLMRLEYFNQWYSLRSYYTCVTLMDLPLQVCKSLFYLYILIIRVKLCAVIHFNEHFNLER